MTSPRSPDLPVAGIDGCPAGWLRIERRANSELAAAVVSTSEIFASAQNYAVVTIDIPIGLSDAGPRAVDVRARQLLERRGSSVFPSPVRAALDGTDYLDACARSFASCGKKLSKQTFAILPKIRDVDAAIRACDVAERVREIHPELSFYHLNAQSPMRYAKRTIEGAHERLELLHAHFGAVFPALRASLPTSDVASDDIVDALAALWSAERVRDGRNAVLPETGERDRFGLRMEMVA